MAIQHQDGVSRHSIESFHKHEMINYQAFSLLAAILNHINFFLKVEQEFHIAR